MTLDCEEIVGEQFRLGVSCSVVQDMSCEAELILATLMESQQSEPLSQQPQPAALGHLGATPGSAVPGDTPWNARGSHSPPSVQPLLLGT